MFSMQNSVKTRLRHHFYQVFDADRYGLNIREMKQNSFMNSAPHTLIIHERWWIFNLMRLLIKPISNLSGLTKLDGVYGFSALHVYSISILAFYAYRGRTVPMKAALWNNNATKITIFLKYRLSPLSPELEIDQIFFNRFQWFDFHDNNQHPKKSATL